jgi:uncharacterized protein (TIGR02246 family)
MRRCGLLVVFWISLAPSALPAEPEKPPPEDPAHNQLRAVREKLVEAFNKRDYDSFLEHLHPNVIVVWQDGSVSRKREGVREYLKKMLEGPNALVQGITYNLETDDLAILHGGSTAIAWGKLGDHYKLRDGRDFSMDSRWSATLVKDGDRWLVASAHGSVPAFDNEILHQAERTVGWWAGGGALLGGLLIGTAVTLLVRRSGPAAGGATGHAS